MKSVLLLLLVAAAAFAAYVWTRPSAFRVERSALIDAPPEVIFANLEDFHRWSAWSPWEKLDPNLQRSFEGPSAGVGASYHWRGNPDVGEGRMTVTASKPPNRLTIRLEFLAPMTVTNEATFLVSPDIASMTEVRWAMSGENGFMAKLASLFIDVRGRVAADFDRGLADLKRVCEEQAAAEDARRAAEAAAAAAAASAEAALAEVPSAQAAPAAP